jgi:hypothetical protein
LEPSNESETRQDQLEVRPQASQEEVLLQVQN